MRLKLGVNKMFLAGLAFIIAFGFGLIHLFVYCEHPELLMKFNKIFLLIIVPLLLILFNIWTYKQLYVLRDYVEMWEFMTMIILLNLMDLCMCIVIFLSGVIEE